MTREEERKQELSETSRRPLMEVAVALTRLLSVIQPLESETLSLTQAAGRVLADEVIARFDYPPFANSGMDGFAVRSLDVSMANRDRPVRLAVIADIPAGQVTDLAIQLGQAARIMTGAAVPEGADAVVPVEDTDFFHRQAGSSAPAQVQVLLL